MLYKGITVELINAAGQAFKEYKDEGDFEDTDEMSHALIELPAPDQNQDFMVSCTATHPSHFPTDKHRLLLRCIPAMTAPEVDRGAGKYIRRANEPTLCEGMVTGYDSTAKVCSYKMLKFAELEIEQTGAVQTGDGKLPPAGLVDVKLWQYTIGKSVPLRGNPLSPKKIIATEKVLKGKDIAFDAE